MSLWKDKQEQQKIFNEVANDFSNNDSGVLGLLLLRDGQLVVSKLMNYIRRVRKGGVIIDAGCGTGSFLTELTESVADTCQIIGIDLSTESIKVAKQKNKSADFLVCDMDALPLRERICDLVILRNVLHHLSTLMPLGKAIGLLKSSGILLIDDKISGNPIQELFILAYPLIPYNFRMILRESAGHVDRYGNLPPITYRSPQAYLNFFKRYSNELTVLEVNYHGFFLFLVVLDYLYHLFPGFSKIRLPYDKLYHIERRNILRWSAVSMTIVVERA
jgi:ubiquinone/menaquinone biosynthesis C-methylase UbiE